MKQNKIACTAKEISKSHFGLARVRIAKKGLFCQIS